MSRAATDRREFLKTSVAAGAGLVIGFYLPAGPLDALAAAAAGATFVPNAFLRIGSDESVTIIVSKSEMGQGVYTSLPMILADELEADWTKVGFEPAPVAPVYNHTAFGIQMTGGSTSVISSWAQLHHAGAMARTMLIAAAADTWKVSPADCRAENGWVVHPGSKRRLSYGRLAEKASRMAAPAEVKLKDTKDFRLIGKPTRRLDTPEKTNGKGIFGIDVRLPGMLTAVVARSPVFGGKLKSFNADKAKAVPGVRYVVEIGTGVAVVADGFWPAKQGRDALEFSWDEGPMARFSSESQREQYARLADQPGTLARKQGDAAAALAAAATKLEAVYEVPYLAHAMMEPLNCVADVRADHCEVWTGTQFQTLDRNAAAEVAGLKPEQVSLHTTLLGGGFGRRAVPGNHFVREAVETSRKVGAPVKVIWTREDDMAGGYYRPAYYHKLAGGLDAQGNPLAWAHTIVGQSIMAGTPFAAMIKNGVDETSVEGAADMTYAIPAISVELHSPKIGVPVLWWRSVGHSHNAFVVESFVDELAHAAGKDPFQVRRALLDKDPRRKAVLETVAEKAGWGKPLPAGKGRGIAVHHSFGSYVAQVAEVAVAKDGSLRVERVVCAIDCGQIVNPDTIRAQMEGAIIFALSAVLYGAITLRNGRVQQGNFDDYAVVRCHEAPAIEVHIVPGGPQGGVGEPGVPPLAPAVANAIFAATGKRLRRLPIRPEDLRQG
jgi:isoquinoline 1-oxidoreductase beta subunit